MGMYRRGEIYRPEKKKSTHPIWRGIGCIMIVLILAMSYFGAVLLVDANQVNGWVPVAKEIQGGPSFFGAWAADLYAELLVALILSIFAFSLFVIGYSFIYKTSVPKDEIDY